MNDFIDHVDGTTTTIDTNHVTNTKATLTNIPCTDQNYKKPISSHSGGLVVLLYGVFASIAFVVLVFSTEAFLHRKRRMKEDEMRCRSNQSPVVKSTKSPGSTGVSRAESEIPKRDISETREHRPPSLPPRVCIGSREREDMAGQLTGEHDENEQRPPNPPVKLQMDSRGNNSRECTFHDADGSRVQLQIKDVIIPYPI